MGMQYVETVPEYVAAHSEDGPPIIDPDSRWELYPDGAFRIDHAMCPPPAEENHRLRMKHRYWFLRLQQEEDAFNYHKAEYQRQASYAAAGGVPLPPAAVIASLQAGKARVEELRRRFKELDDAVQQLPEIAVLRKQREILRERERQAHDLIGAINGISINEGQL